jgi:WD40 repeat protein
VLTWGLLAEGDDKLASASGDQTIRVWDMTPERPEATATLRGHKGSVKSVQFRPRSRCELVSGARGGDIILWDTRVGQGAVTAMSVKVSSA